MSAEILQAAINFITLTMVKDDAISNVMRDRLPALHEDDMEAGRKICNELAKMLDAMQSDTAVSCDPEKWLCPHCRTKPVATLTRTYYAEIPGYMCDCTRIPNSVECAGDSYS